MKCAISIILLFFSSLLFSQETMNFDIYLIGLRTEWGTVIGFEKPVNISNHKGYDNHPSFSSDSRQVYYTSFTIDSTADIQVYDLVDEKPVRMKPTPFTNEYSPTALDVNNMVFVRIEDDGITTRIWKQQLPRGKPELFMDKVDSVGYYAISRTQDHKEIAAVINSSDNEFAHELKVVDVKTQKETFVDDSVGRRICFSPDSSALIYIKKRPDGKNKFMSYNFKDGSIGEMMETVEGAEEFAYYDKTKIWMFKDGHLYEYWLTAKYKFWDEKKSFISNIKDLKNITRVSLSPNKEYLVIVADE